MFDVCQQLGLDHVQFRRDNFYRAGDVSHFGQVVTEDDITMEACLDECISRADYHNTKLEVDQFNQENKYKKRGIAMIPFRKGCGYAAFGQV